MNLWYYDYTSATPAYMTVLWVYVEGLGWVPVMVEDAS